MEFEKMTISELKEFLDEHAVDYSEANVKADYVELAQETNVTNSDDKDTTSSEQTNSLLDKVQAAKQIDIERTVIKKSSDTDYLIGRDYDSLTAGERLIIREKSPEYESKEVGVEVHITNRLGTNWRIVKLHDRSYSKLLKDKIYTLTQADFDVLKNVTVKVKTEATKNKCCGQAVYEQILLLEVLND